MVNQNLWFYANQESGELLTHVCMSLYTHLCVFGGIYPCFRARHGSVNLGIGTRSYGIGHTVMCPAPMIHTRMSRFSSHVN